MSTIDKKIRILRENREWTQAQLAEKVFLSPDAIYKWEKGINTPKLQEIKSLCEIFMISIDKLTDDAQDIVSYWLIENEWPAEMAIPYKFDSTPHKVYDADLCKGATLHRFLNYAGEPYSAVYVGSYEQLSCERDHEQGMLDFWNDER